VRDARQLINSRNPWIELKDLLDIGVTIQHGGSAAK
jgi:hypothetical protein